MKTKILNTDVLVVGGGLGGMVAAFESARRGAEVMLLDKGVFGKSGCSASANEWTIPYKYVRGDSAKAQSDDNVKFSSSVCDPDLSYESYKESLPFVAMHEEFGVFFQRNSDGTPWLGCPNPPRAPVPQGPSRAHIVRRCGGTGKWIVDAWKRMIQRMPSITVRDETPVTRILTNNGEAVGATAYGLLNGDFFAVKAKSIILATGAGGWLYKTSTMGREMTADGHAMSYRAGAEITNMEFHAWLPYSLAFPEIWTRIGLFGTREGDYQYYYNAKGEHFMDDIEWIDGLRTVKTSRVMREVAEGRGSPRGGVFWGALHVPYDVLVEGWEYTKFLEKLGIDLSKELVEVIPAPHTYNGGLVINRNAETNVPGLFAAGSCIGVAGDPNLNLCTGFGSVAPRYACKRASEMDKPELNIEQVEDEENRVLSFTESLPNRTEATLRPAFLKKIIRDTMYYKFGYFKTEESLNGVWNEIQKIRREIVPLMCTETDTRLYNYELIECLDVMNMLDVCEMQIQASLRRRETRGAHIRLDYPEKDDKNWLKFLIIKRENGQMKFHTRPLDPKTANSNRLRLVR